MCCRIILFLLYSTHVVFRIYIELLLDNLELCSTPVGEALWDHWLRASHRSWMSGRRIQLHSWWAREARGMHGGAAGEERVRLAIGR